MGSASAAPVGCWTRLRGRMASVATTRRYERGAPAQRATVAHKVSSSRGLARCSSACIANGVAVRMWPDMLMIGMCAVLRPARKL